MANQKVMIGFKTDAEIRNKLEMIAEIEDRSISYLVNKFVKQGIENYISRKGEEGKRALEVAHYIDELDFSSYEDFLKITGKNKTYEWIIEELGALQTYILVCEKLNKPIDQQVVDSIEIQKMLEDD